MIRRSITLVRSNGSKNDSFFDLKTDPNIVYAVRKPMNSKIKKYRNILSLLYDFQMPKQCLKCKIKSMKKKRS